MSELTAGIPNSWHELLLGNADIYIKAFDFDLNEITATAEVYFSTLNITVLYSLKAGEGVQYPTIQYLYHHFFMCVLLHANSITLVNSVLINDQNFNEDQFFALSMINLLHENSSRNSVFKTTLIFQSELNSGFEAISY